MKYFFAGATSKTGLAVLERLIPYAGAEKIYCLVRPTSMTTHLERLGVNICMGDVTDPSSFQDRLNMNVSYIDMTHPKYYHISLNAIVKAGVKRAFFVTTTGVFSQYNQASEIYRLNEGKIQQSGLDYTILRPTMIYGSSQDKNMNRLIRFLSRYPIFPVFGGGHSLMQPIYIDDLADGIVAAIINPFTKNQAYNLAGPKSIEFGEVVNIILNELDRKVLKLNISLNLAANIARYAQLIPVFPLTEEQVLRLQEDKAFDISKAIDELQFSPRSFAEGIKAEIREMRVSKIIR
jgi:nucleoside-diphosphate-sugar epimerase